MIFSKVLPLLLVGTAVAANTAAPSLSSSANPAQGASASPGPKKDTNGLNESANTSVLNGPASVTSATAVPEQASNTNPLFGGAGPTTGIPGITTPPDVAPNARVTSVTTSLPAQNTGTDVTPLAADTSKPVNPLGGLTSVLLGSHSLSDTQILPTAPTAASGRPSATTTQGSGTGSQGPDSSQASQAAAAAASNAVQGLLGGLLGGGGSLGNVGTELEELLKGVTGLLSPTLVSDLEEVVHDAAQLLKGDTTPQTKQVLAAAYQLLNPSTATEIINAVHVAQRIITPQVISELEEASLAQVLQEIGTVYTTVKKFIENYKQYIPANIASDLESILNNLTTLLSAATVKDLQGILTSVDNLLTPDVINSLKFLLTGIGPLVSDAESLISKIEPLIGDLEPLWDKVEPYLSKTGSFVDEYLTSDNISKLGTLIDNIESIVGTIAGVLTPGLFSDIENGASSYFPAGFLTKAKSLLSIVWDMLSVQGVQNVATLLDGLESLLTPTAVQDIQNVGGLVGPYLTQDSLNKAKSTLSTLYTYGEDVWDGAKDIFDDLSSYYKDYSSSNITSIIPSSTISKAKSLLSTVWDMLSVQGIENVATLLDGLESLLTPTVVQDIRNVGGLIGPYLDEKHIKEFNSTIGNLSTYGAEVWNMTGKYWNSTEKYLNSTVLPHLSEYLSDAETVYDKVYLLFSWIGPEITKQNLQTLSGYLHKVANDTGDVVDVVTGLLNSNVTGEVEKVVKTAEGYLTPKFFDDAASIFDSLANILPGIASFISSI